SLLVLELEGSRGSKADRGDDGVLAKLGLVVGVPGDAVLAGAVPVQENAVEDNSRRRLHGPLDLQNGRRPWQWIVFDSRVTVTATLIAVPRGQAREVDVLPIKLHRFLSPGGRVLQLPEETVGIRSGEQGRTEHYLGLRKVQGLDEVSPGICCQSWHGL